MFGERRVLADLSATLEILAHQVALTLESVTLRQEVIRQRNEAYFRALVQDASDAIVIVADDGTVKYATPSTVAIFGDITVEGERLWDLVAEQDRDDFARTFMRLRRARAVRLRASWSGRSPAWTAGSVRIQARCSDLREEPTVAGLVFTLRDVTEQHELEEELKYRAFHDALTGLPNRLLFQEDGGAVETARADGTTAGVLFVDLDDFKVVNDTKGHSVGDELLVAVAARLAALGPRVGHRGAPRRRRVRAADR